jgi:hypothetical protein
MGVHLEKPLIVRQGLYSMVQLTGYVSLLFEGAAGVRGEGGMGNVARSSSVLTLLWFFDKFPVN